MEQRMTAIGVSSLLVKLSHQSEHVQGIRYVYDLSPRSPAALVGSILHEG